MAVLAKKKIKIIIKNGQKRRFKTTREIPHEQPDKRKIAIKYGQKRHTETPKTTTAILAEFLTSIANDDLLLEIFTRLPNSRAVCRCAAVCRRWHSVISHPQFVTMFKRHHQQQRVPAGALPFTLLLRDGYERLLPPPAGRRPHAFGEYFSEESKKLHGPIRSSCKAKYLEFLPAEAIVRASWKDLLVVQLGGKRCLCVCNPLTRQRVWLPKTPLVYISDYALVCDPTSEQSCYRVLAIFNYRRHMIRVAVFRSETGRWDEPVLSFPIEGALLPRLPMAVGTRDGIIYTPLAVRDMWAYKKIAAFDTFDVRTGLCYREVSLPAGFHRGWSEARIGVVRGQLRLWQTYLDKRTSLMSKFVFRVWRLDKKYDNWVSLHDLKLATGDESKFMGASVVVALHPDDDDVFFFKNNDRQIWQYRIGTGSYEKNGQIDKIQYSTVVYTVVHQPWPTVIPQLHSI